MDFKGQKSFLKELQSLEESTKRKVLVIATIIIMAIVIYIWLGYFNNIVAGSTEQPVAVNQSKGNALNNANVFQNIKNALANIANTLQGPGQYIIQPKQLSN